MQACLADFLFSSVAVIHLVFYFFGILWITFQLILIDVKIKTLN